MNRKLVRLPAGQRKLAIEALLGGSVVLGVLAWAIGLEALALAGLALLLSAGLMLVVQAPTGPVPLGYALIIALAALMPAAQYVGVVGLGVLATVPALAGRFGQREALARIGRWLTAATAAGVVSFLYRFAVTTTSPVAVLGGVVAIGVAFLYADQAAEHVFSSKDTVVVSLRAAWPVDLALLCGAGLITLAYREGGHGGGAWMAAVAVLPLLMTRFAYDRYAAAQQAYQQTIKALGIVPEIAGVTPLGHGERSAVYAVALARRLGLDLDAVERAATAARLHHIGYVTLDDPVELAAASDHRVLARLGGDILRETAFLADVGDLVESVSTDDGALITREAAVVRVATSFDDLVLEDPTRADAALAILAFEQRDAFGSAAVLALRWCVEEDSGLVERAIASAAPLTLAAAELGGSHV